jgi:hypothetical protein
MFRLTQIPFELPTGEIATLRYGVKFPAGASLYLQSLRSASQADWSYLAGNYHAVKREFAARLAGTADEALSGVDAVVSPPSLFPDATLYRLALTKGRSVQDLSDGFARAAESFEYIANAQEPGIRSLAIIDTAIATGATAATALDQLRKAGLPKNCEVQIIAWALL